MSSPNIVRVRRRRIRRAKPQAKPVVVPIRPAKPERFDLRAA